MKMSDLIGIQLVENGVKSGVTFCILNFRVNSKACELTEADLRLRLISYLKKHHFPSQEKLKDGKCYSGKKEIQDTTELLNEADFEIYKTGYNVYFEWDNKKVKFEVYFGGSCQPPLEDLIELDRQIAALTDLHYREQTKSWELARWDFATR